MKVETQQFGELEFTEELIVRFPKGLIGFEDARNFIIINHEDYEPFRWLISVDQKELGFQRAGGTIVFRRRSDGHFLRGHHQRRRGQSNH